MKTLLPRVLGLALALFVAGSHAASAQNDLNLALSKPSNTGATATASASSVENDNAALVASNVNDGNHASRWASQFADPQSLVINLGSVQPIDRIRIEWESAYGVGFELQVSNDERFATYTTVKKVTDNTPTAHNRETFVNEFGQLGATGQYIRLVCTQRRIFGYDNNGQPIRYGYSVREIGVFSFSNDPVKNVAANQKADASGVESASYTPDKAFDGDPATRWSTPYGEYQTLQIDLGKTTSIARAYVNWEDAYATDFELQTSSDGTPNNWTTFATYTNNQAFYNEVGVVSSGRCLRVLAKKGFGSFSIYEFGLYASSTPLPVTLTSFGAAERGTGVALNWTTASEQNSASFEVQRSTDGVQFKGIGQLAAAGNSQSIKAYQYFDAAPARPVGYYRLKQVDLDGRTTYGPVAVVRLAGTATAQALTIYPNPVADQATLQWDAPLAGPSHWRLTSTTGQVVRQGVVEAQQGANSQFIDLRNCAAGSYVLSVEAAGQPLQRKLVQKQ